MPSLLLHTCCAPCLTAVEERLRAGYSLDIFWYNPNIYPVEEYERRLAELHRFSTEVLGKAITQPPLTDDRQLWDETVVDYALEPEGRRRCGACIGFRLEKTAQYAAAHQYDLFCTTLTVSPRKSSVLVNKLGSESAARNGIAFLEADFKKQDGFLRSVELSKQYGLYRQNYCGCIYSMKESLFRHMTAAAG